ncbi:TfoX/Sxy family protein [Rickettsia helvetica]|uniref:TfoX N-terminal domain-containing protein n=1 Tax=Rickettsia helvetica TaxID=35789 RepID=A0ABP0T2F3_RICHE|nr:TfoX/Sxy family protein [Rickettsia helvetica]MCZ6884347.1 TfoX/Sxy family protein [Rickettsia endosymbiont of Ixodes ricinus]MCZ6896818.1 TfoX/Sxy family protein [Rickettsia endosymbiont of Ixodes ricinus]
MKLYFKSDLSTYEYFQSFGSEPFIYQSKSKLITLSYWKVLPEIMEDQELLGKWFKLALNAAINSQKKNKCHPVVKPRGDTERVFQAMQRRRSSHGMIRVVFHNLKIVNFAVCKQRYF